MFCCANTCFYNDAVLLCSGLSTQDRWDRATDWNAHPMLHGCGTLFTILPPRSKQWRGYHAIPVKSHHTVSLGKNTMFEDKVRFEPLRRPNLHPSGSPKIHLVFFVLCTKILGVGRLSFAGTCSCSWWRLKFAAPDLISLQTQSKNVDSSSEQGRRQSSKILQGTQQQQFCQIFFCSQTPPREDHQTQLKGIKTISFS